MAAAMARQEGYFPSLKLPRRRSSGGRPQAVSTLVKVVKASPAIR